MSQKDKNADAASYDGSRCDCIEQKNRSENPGIYFFFLQRFEITAQSTGHDRAGTRCQQSSIDKRIRRNTRVKP